MVSRITVRPTAEASFVPIAPATQEALLAELERQGIEVGRVYRYTAAGRKLGMDKRNEFRDQLESLGCVGGCSVLESFGDADDLLSLMLAIYRDTSNATPIRRRETPDAEAETSFSNFFTWVDELDYARETDCIENIEGFGRMVEESWPNVLDKLDAGIEYCRDKKDEDGLNALKGLRNHVVRYLLDEGKITADEANEILD